MHNNMMTKGGETNQERIPIAGLGEFEEKEDTPLGMNPLPRLHLFNSLNLW